MSLRLILRPDSELYVETALIDIYILREQH